MKKVKVLVFDVDPEEKWGERLRGFLAANAGLLDVKSVSERGTSRAAKRLPSVLTSFSPDLGFLILGSLAQPAIAQLFSVWRLGNTARPLIAVVNTGEPQDVAGAIYHGANDFLIPPLRAMDVLPRLWRWVAETREKDDSIEKLKHALGLPQFVGESHDFMDELKKIPRFARSDANILIGGESGTGKEVAALALHSLSPRALLPFVALNCAVLPAELVENELFGHEPGAHSTALASSLGLIREADGGSLFLDEVGCLSLATQAKFLRVLQNKEVRPLGSRKTYKVNVRIIAASNRNLEEEVQHSRFRQDLFFRLNILTLTMPPLRQRDGDVPLLARFFAAKFSIEGGKAARSFSPAAMQKLVLYEWPGNVRELEHVIQRTLVLSEHPIIEPGEIALPRSAAASGTDSFQALKAIAIADWERKRITELLSANEGNVTKVALASKKDRRSIQRLIEKHGISTETFSTRPSAK